MILLFGGAGFLGASISKCLSESKIEFAVVTRETTDLWRIQDLQNIQIIRTNLEEQDELITRLKPETIVCANWIGVEKKLRSDISIQLPNEKHIIKLGRAAIEANVKKFVVLGSQDEISPSPDLILDDSRPNSTSEYGNVKNSLKTKLEEYFHKTNSVLIWARVFSIYGEFDLSDSLIPQMVRSAKSKKAFHIKEPFKEWSYLYQSDFANAVKEIILKVNLNQTINIGNPKSVRISEITNLVVEELREYELELKLLSEIGQGTSVPRIPDSA